MRLLCLYFPRLASRLALRDRPHLSTEPVVLIGGHGDEALVVAATPPAGARQVFPGLTAGQAHRRCPQAIFLPDNAGDCLDLLERVAAILRVRATPLVELGGRDHLFIDLAGISGEEAAVAASLTGLVRAWTGFEVRAGVAANRADALEAARPARRLPAVAPHGGQAAEPPVSSFEPQEITATATVPTGVALSTALRRLTGRLQALLEGSRQTYRSARIELETGGASTTVFVRRLRQPSARAEDALDALLPRLSPLASTSAVRVRLTLARLGPDVRVRVCPERRRVSQRSVSLRAAS